MDANWEELLKPEMCNANFLSIKRFITEQKALGKRIFPPERLVFNAFKFTPFEKVSVVILGQDPYHGNGQAHGLSFSVPRGVNIPPSLKNIYKEIQYDLQLPIPLHGDLSNWANQGVLLLNAVLTVNEAEPGSHARIGWENFTDAVIRLIAQQKEHVVFMLWGKYAQQKLSMVHSQNHLVLQAAHPSPLSAHQGFFGCKHFSKANEYLVKHGLSPIDWSNSD